MMTEFSLWVNKSLQRQQDLNINRMEGLVSLSLFLTYSYTYKPIKKNHAFLNYLPISA